MVNTKVTLSGWELDNPVIAASGTFGYGKEFAKLYDINILGTFSFKGTTVQPRFGNPTPRIAESDAGILLSVGLQNPGMERVLAEELPEMKKFFHKKVIANLSGFSAEEYVKLCEAFGREEQVGILEVNVSCPNVKAGGMATGASCENVYAIAKAVKQATDKPVYMKLSPNVTDIVAIAKACEEGGAFQDGKGKTVWDDYCEKGLIYHKQTCAFACDSYNRLNEDLALIKELGLTAYRFSISWARIQPAGSGAINQKGIDYYNRLIDGCLAMGIEPFVTLFHWDLPVPLWEAGGFLNRDIIERFAEYAKIVAENFGDRVKYFSVFNEAAALIDFLYLRPVGGGYEPYSMQKAFEALHTLLLCNAAATKNLRKYSKNAVRVGMVNVTDVKVPADENNPADVEAARKGTFAPHGIFGTTTFWDPLIFGKYDECIIENNKLDLSFVQSGDMEQIKCSPDFLGLNIYRGTAVKADEHGEPVEVIPATDALDGEMGGDVVGTASCMYYGPKFLQERYKLPVYVTETGISLPEWLPKNGGRIMDTMRTDYIERYFAELKRAKADGVDIRGYFVWTLIDNFEWSSGYSRRFGLVYVNHDTGERTKKQSFYDYQALIKANADI